MSGQPGPKILNKKVVLLNNYCIRHDRFLNHVFCQQCPILKKLRQLTIRQLQLEVMLGSMMT